MPLDAAVIARLRAWLQTAELPPAPLVIVLVVLLALNSFSHLVQPWCTGLTGHITTTGT